MQVSSCQTIHFNYKQISYTGNHQRLSTICSALNYMTRGINQGRAIREFSNELKALENEVSAFAYKTPNDSDAELGFRILLLAKSLLFPYEKLPCAGNLSLSCCLLNSMMHQVSQMKDITGSKACLSVLISQFIPFTSNPEDSDYQMALKGLRMASHLLAESTLFEARRPSQKFNRLETPICAQIFFLAAGNPKNLCNLRLVSKFFNEIADSNAVWKPMCTEEDQTLLGAQNMMWKDFYKKNMYDPYRGEGSRFVSITPLSGDSFEIKLNPAKCRGVHMKRALQEQYNLSQKISIVCEGKSLFDNQLLSEFMVNNNLTINIIFDKLV